ncbi:hypothetical protein D3C85_855810 [compost metagenome]
MFDLGFLEVGLDPDVRVRHQGQQMGAYLHILAVARSSLADAAIHGRADLGAAEVQLGLGNFGAGVGDLRVEALDFGVQRIHLLALGLEVGLGLGHLGTGDTGVGGERSDPLFGDEARLAQGLGPGQVDLGAAQGGLAGGYIRLAGCDQVRLLGQFALRLGQLGLAGGEEGACAFQGELEVVGFQADQQVAFLHLLVVADQHFVDPGAQLAGHPGDLALHVGVVGAFDEAADQQPVSEEASDDQCHQSEKDEKAALQFGRHGKAVLEVFAECCESSSVPHSQIAGTIQKLCCL